MNNDTASADNAQTSSSTVGLAVGLPLFFLLLVVAAAVVIYKMFERIRRVLPFGNRESPKKEDNPETPQAVPHQYSTLVREQSIVQAPIYENTGYRRPAAEQSSPPREPEEDVYLQCDSEDDGIYLNDPSYNFRTDEDVYIDPNS